MPECCLCDPGCSLILFCIIVLLLFIILVTRPKQPSLSVVNNQASGGTQKPPVPPKKKKCIDIIRMLSCYAFIGIVVLYVICLYPKKKYDYFIYDTLKENSDYVIASLKVGKLQVLDRVLMIEKKECGQRIARNIVRTMVNGDQDVIDAYDRWRDIKTFSRSYDHWIYPDERKIYIQKYDLMWPRKMLVRTDRLLPICKKLPGIK